MNPVEGPLHDKAQRVIFGVNQEKDYFQLPASVDVHGTVMTEWELTAEELSMILNGGRVRLWMLFTGVTVGRPLTPIKLEVVTGD